MEQIKIDSDLDTTIELNKRVSEETKGVDTKSESPSKIEHSILTLFKEVYTKNRVLGENTSLIPLIIAPAYLGIRKIVTQERMTYDRHKVRLRM
jgi:hypothetical protein